MEHAGRKGVFVMNDERKGEARSDRLKLESVLGSVEALPNESLGLDQEIEEATEEALAKRNVIDLPLPLGDDSPAER